MQRGAIVKRNAIYFPVYAYPVQTPYLYVKFMKTFCALYLLQKARNCNIIKKNLK